MLLLIAAQMAASAAAADPPPAPSSGSSAIEAVVVTARKPITGDLQQGVVAYTPTFFTPVRPSSALDMVNWLPGFVFEDTRDMRGLEGSTGNVLIDGKPPTSKTDTLTSVLRRIPADQVERVDLIVGSAPGLDMHGRNIIANVVLKKRDKPLQVVTVASYLDTHGRPAPTLSLTHSDKRNDRVTEASLELVRNIAIFPTFGYGPYVRRDASGAVLLSADERFEYDGPYMALNASHEFPLGGGRLRTNGLLRLTHETQIEVDQLTSGAGRYGADQRDDYVEGELGARYEHGFGPLALETQVLERYRRIDAFQGLNRPPQPSDDTIKSQALESIQRAVLRYKRGETFTLEGSGEHTRNDSDSHTRATQNHVPVFVPVADVALVEDRWEAGTGLTWKPNGRFSLNAAFKVETAQLSATGDIVTDRRRTYPKPKLAMSWSPDKLTQLRVRAEYEVNQVPLQSILTFNESNSGQLQNGNADLNPPRAWVGEAVFERHFWSTGDLTLTARYKAHEDLLDAAPRFTSSGQAFQQLSNIGRGRETDLIGNLLVPLKPFGIDSANLRAVVTWQRARVADPVSGMQRPLSNIPELVEELHYAQDFPMLKTNWGIDAFYRGRTALYRPFGNETTAAWPHVNVFVEHRFEHEFALRVELQNLPGVRSKQTISVFSGLRDRSALTYVDDKRLSVGPMLFVRLRKTL